MKKAFTLTEMIVVLGLIGVITAIMMTQVRSMHDKQNILLYKNSFSTLQGISSKLAGDTTLFPIPELGFKYGKIASRNTDDEAEGNRAAILAGGNTAADAEYFCRMFTNKLLTERYRNATEDDVNAGLATIVGEEIRDINCETAGNIDSTFTPNITLPNGVQISGLGAGAIFSDDDDLRDYNESHINICVDTNGTAGPNNGCDQVESDPILRRDRFRIRINYNGRFTTDLNWRIENEILDPENRATDIKSEDFPDNNVE